MSSGISGYTPAAGCGRRVESTSVSGCCKPFCIQPRPAVDGARRRRSLLVIEDRGPSTAHVAHVPRRGVAPSPVSGPGRQRPKFWPPLGITSSAILIVGTPPIPPYTTTLTFEAMPSRLVAAPSSSSSEASTPEAGGRQARDMTDRGRRQPYPKNPACTFPHPTHVKSPRPPPPAPATFHRRPDAELPCQGSRRALTSPPRCRKCWTRRGGR